MRLFHVFGSIRTRLKQEHMENLLPDSEILMAPLHRLFFAIRPPESARPYFLEEQRRFGPGRAVREEYLHLTTALSNDYQVFPSVLATRMLAIGDAVIADQFRIVLDQVVASRHSASNARTWKP